MSAIIHPGSLPFPSAPPPHSTLPGTAARSTSASKTTLASAESVYQVFDDVSGATPPYSHRDPDAMQSVRGQPGRCRKGLSARFINPP